MTDPATVEVRDPRLEELLDPAATLEVIADGLDFCEGPVWSEPEGFLLFTDIAMNTIRRWDPDGGLSTFRQPSNKANGLTRDNAGRLLACEHVSSTVSRTDQDGNISAAASHWEGKELNSPNDVVAARTEPSTSPTRRTGASPSAGVCCGSARSTSRGSMSSRRAPVPRKPC